MSADDMAHWIRTLFLGTDAIADVSANNEHTVSVDLEEYYGDESAAAIQELERDVGSHGWYVTNSAALDSGDDVVTIVLHRLKGEPVQVPRYVYHITSAQGAERAMRDGLRLSKGSQRHAFKYPPRVFFTREPDGADGMDLGFGSGSTGAVLKIDTNKVQGLRLYADPEFYEDDPVDWTAAYAEVPIPSDAITLERDMKFEALLRAMIGAVISEGRDIDDDDPAAGLEDLPEYASVEAFVEQAIDDKTTTFTHVDLIALARSSTCVPAPSQTQVHAIRKELEGYGLRLVTREPERQVRGIGSSAHGTHPFAGAGGGGSGFSSSFGAGGFTSFGGGPGAMGSGKEWDPDAKSSLRMGAKPRKR